MKTTKVNGSRRDFQAVTFLCVRCSWTRRRSKSCMAGLKMGVSQTKELHWVISLGSHKGNQHKTESEEGPKFRGAMSAQAFA